MSFLPLLHLWLPICAARVAPGRVLFELGGVPIREELARKGMKKISSVFSKVLMFLISAFSEAAAKLPLQVAFISRSTPPRLGNIDILPGMETLINGKRTIQPPMTTVQS